MLRLLAVPMIALALLVAVPPGAGAGGSDRSQADERSARAVAALDIAKAALAPSGARGQGAPDVTLALLDLRIAYAHLPAARKPEADRIFARPTDSGSGDFAEYHVPETTPACGPNVCIHYVTSTSDAPPLTDANLDGVPDWVQTNLNVMESVWAKEVSGLGYRAPATDGTRGGDDRFDVYLANLGDQNLYGYCAAESKVPGHAFRYSGYCVLDNDFAEFAMPGLPSLRVTAAHEFFHAIQFNYDAGEDRWLMEATATWMEERYADDVNDNRSFLKYGQLRRNGVPLDRFEPSGFAQYGNWLFFERLSQTYGAGAIKSLWQRMDSTYPSKDQYSSQAIRNFLAGKSTTYRAFYAKFAAGNLIPSRVYTEGSAYPKAPIASTTYLSPATRGTGTRSLRLDHLTNRSFAVVPRSTLTGTWRLRVIVDGPPLAYGTTGYVMVHRKDGKVGHKLLSFDSTGKARFYAAFSPTKVSRVTVTIGNASTRFNCWKGSNLSCQGNSLDNGRGFTWSARAVR